MLGSVQKTCWQVSLQTWHSDCKCNAEVCCCYIQVSILESAVLLLRRMPHFRPPADVDPSLQTFDDLQAFTDQRYLLDAS